MQEEILWIESLLNVQDLVIYGLLVFENCCIQQIKV